MVQEDGHQIEALVRDSLISPSLALVRVETGTVVVIDQNARVIDHAAHLPGMEAHGEVVVDLGALATQPLGECYRLSAEGHVHAFERMDLAGESLAAVVPPEKPSPGCDLADPLTGSVAIAVEHIASADGYDVRVSEVGGQPFQPVGRGDGIVIGEGDQVTGDPSHRRP